MDLGRKTMKSLREKIKEFATEEIHEQVKKAKQLHEQFLETFPLHELKNMTLEQYALGRTKKSSFSWWLEYNTIPLGSIKGGSASKHIIYYRRKDNRWDFPSQFENVEQAWEQLKKDIILLVDSINDKEYVGIDEDNLLYRANMLKGKILYLYNPDKMVTVYNENHIRKFLLELGVSESELEGKDSIELNMQLRQLIDEHDELKDFDPILIIMFLYHEFMREEQYVKVSPGRDAMNWTQCLQGGYISVGWDEIGDLTEFNDYEEFKTTFHSYNFHSKPQKNTEKANELWEFYQLNSGDKVIANKGKTQILGIGTVTDCGYEYRDDLSSHKHVVYVNWDKVFDPPLEIPKQEYWGYKTVTKVSKKQVLEWTSEHKEKTNTSREYTTEEEKFFEMVEQALARKGQIILYGPPGTGKTYLARKFIKWKNGKENLFNNNHIESPKTWLMVASEKAHSFRWEDILNGKTKRWNVKTVKKNFKIAKKGEKILCYRGGSNQNALVGIAEISDEYNGESVEVKGICKFDKEIAYDDFKDLPEYKSTQAGKMGNRGTMFELNEDFINWVHHMLIENGDEKSAKILDELVNQSNMEMCTFHPSFQYEDFIEGFKPMDSGNGSVTFQLEKGIFHRFASKASENEKVNYYFIIDELNRGNVPKIFGELITILEKDKRGIELRLPQSKEMFTIPNNLYIIATMNTSDRSIKMMDAALKRRFAFIECMPNYELIDQPIDLLSITPADILRSLNEKLIHLQGRDKQIGHAYFMDNGVQVKSVTELKEVFKYEIIPLVQEYCFDDYVQLAEIIGEDFVDIDNMEININLFNGPDDHFIQAIEKQFKDSER